MHYKSQNGRLCEVFLIIIINVYNDFNQFLLKIVIDI